MAKRKIYVRSNYYLHFAKMIYNPFTNDFQNISILKTLSCTEVRTNVSILDTMNVKQKNYEESKYVILCISAYDVGST